MIKKLEILDTTLDRLEEINNSRFLFEKFKEVNLQIENLLVEIKSSEINYEKNESSLEYINIFKNLLNKIENLEKKISPKANLLESFSKSNS